MNVFLPTHSSERSQPQGEDEEENHLYSRNRCIFMDSSTRAAMDSEGDYFLFTYRQDFGEGRYRALRSVFVPLMFNGSQWGLYELDRKSVGLGKSVSVRVDLGGGRFIKKKKKEKTEAR